MTTIEQKIKNLIGELQFANLSLAHENEQLKEKIKELEEKFKKRS